MIDNRTTNLDLPLPNVDNFQTDDVQRLIDALSALDTEVFARASVAAMNTAISNAIASLVGSAPLNLNTIQELAAAINNDPSFYSTVATSLAGKLPSAPATASVLGGVKVGSGLNVAPDGTISVTGTGLGTGLPAIDVLTITPASNGQTVFTISGGYIAGMVQVFVNGALYRGNGDDYTASNGTSITFTAGLNTTDSVDVFRWKYLPPELAVNKTGDTMTGPLVLPGNATDNLQAVPKQQLDTGLASKASAEQIGSWRSVLAFSTSQSLTASQAGSIIEHTGSSDATYTLPDLAGVADARVFAFLNFSSGVLTVQRAGTNSIYDDRRQAQTAIAVQPGDSLMVFATSTGWLVFSGSWNTVKRSGSTLTGPLAFSAEFDAGNTGAAKTINFASGQKQKMTLTANCTLTLQFPGVGNYVLRALVGATAYSLTWPAGTKFFGGTAPLAPVSNGTAIYTVYYDGSVAHIAGGRE